MSCSRSTPLKKLNTDEEHISEGDEWVITEDNSLSDVVHWLIENAHDIDEVRDLVDDAEKHSLHKELRELDKRRAEILTQIGAI